MEHLEIFGANPYSPALVLGLVFGILAAVNFEVMLRTKVRYFMWMGWGMLSASAFWGTTELQDVGKLYITWGWWWAQPLFALAVSTISISVLQYLPLQTKEQVWLTRLAVYPAVLYIGICTLLLLLEIQIVRLYAVMSLTPPVFAMAYAALRSEKIEPGRGHRMIGLLILMLPLLSVAFPLFKLNTGVLRFWTAIPLVVLAITILAVSLLREREELQKQMGLLKRAEADLAKTNEDLEQRVEDRTAMLQEVISDLESFNRNVSHDIRSPLGSIGLMAFTGKKMLEAGQTTLAIGEFDHIATQVSHAQRMVSTMLDLANRLEERTVRQPVDLEKLVKERVSSVEHFLLRKHPDGPHPVFTVHALPPIESDSGLLRIAFDNLLENAVTHNPDWKQLHVEIGIGRHDQKTCLFVRDNGVGLSGGDNTLYIARGDERPPTYGFGLRIVSRALGRLGGDVVASERAEGGAVFWIRLPCLDDQA